MYDNEFQNLQGRIGAANASKGFHGSDDCDPKDINLYWITKIALAIGELSEAVEEIRAGHGVTEKYEKDGKPEGFPIELADAVIRILDLAEEAHIDLWDAIDEKLRYNNSRAFKHGKQF